MKKKFNNKILIIGFGSVSQCTLPVLTDKIDVGLENITIIDFADFFQLYCFLIIICNVNVFLCVLKKYI